MKYLTVQDLVNLCSTKTDGKVSELVMHHWFTLYGKVEEKVDTAKETKIVE